MLTRLLVVILMVSPLMLGGTWMYQASADAFALQHAVRVAQNDRSRLLRIHLAKESDVFGYAATHAPEFAEQYEADSNAFIASSADLEADLKKIDADYEGTAIARETELYKAWESKVAIPIIRKNAAITQALLAEDRKYSRAFLAEDADIQRFLSNAESTSESHRQGFLRQVLLASIGLVTSAALIIGMLLAQRERAERRRIAANSQFEEEQRITTMLQRSLAPDALPKFENVALHAVYTPAALKHFVGGDWYELVELSEGRVMCIIGDVAGHGLDAAVIMNRARQSILAAAAMDDDPAKILERANRLMLPLNTSMVTAACCIINTATRSCTYATAGHPAPVIASPGRAAITLPSGAPPLGLFDELALTKQEWTLEPDSCLFLFTDGLLENERDLISSEKHILEVASVAAFQANPAVFLFEQVVPSGKPLDDVAVLSIHFS